MRNKNPLLILTVFILISSLSGCVDDTDTFVGSWENQSNGNIIIFNTNGTCLMHRQNEINTVEIIYGIQYLYSVSGGKITIEYDQLLYSVNGSLASNFTGGTHTYEYSFSQDKSALELTEIASGESQLFHRTNITADQLKR